MSSTQITDTAVRELGLINAYTLSLVDRYSQLNTGVESVADRCGLTRNRLRRALHWLRAAGYITDHTPGQRHAPHVYTLSETGKALLTEQVTQNRSPIPDSTTTTYIHESDSLESVVVSTPKPKQVTQNGRPEQPRQTVLIEDPNAQNLGALDIEAQSHLVTLGIRADLRQSFKAAPLIAKQKTPAEILMFHDDTRAIARNLAAWRAAWDAGAEITDKPALIWAKIVELQAPPTTRTESVGTWYTEAEKELILR